MSEKSAITGHIPAAENAAFPGSSTQSPGAPGNSTHGQPAAADNAAGAFPWRGARTRARPALAAVAVTVIALAAFLGTTKPALAAPVSRTSEQGTNAGTAVMAARLSSAPAVSGNPICVISSASDDACDSTNRELIVDSVNHGNTEDCTFTWKMYWGDGTTETVTDDGSATLPTITKAIHIYQEPQKTTIYDVYWDAVSVTGGCYIGSGNGSFVLVVPGT